MQLSSVRSYRKDAGRRAVVKLAMSNPPYTAFQYAPTHQQPAVSAELITDAMSHADLERQRLALSAADASAAVKRSIEHTLAAGTLSEAFAREVRAAITDILEVQAAIATYFNRACRFAERVRRQYCLVAGDGEEAVAHAYKKLQLHIRNINTSKWGWLQRTIVNFLKSRVRHVMQAEEKEDSLRTATLADNERRQAAYCPVRRAAAAELSEHLKAVLDARIARCPSPVRAAVARALLSDTYDAAAIAKAYGSSVQWVSMIKRELLDHAAEHLPRSLAPARGRRQRAKLSRVRAA